MHGEEMAVEGVVREVLEETGYSVVVEELAFVREFIPSRLGSDRYRDGFHQIELYFLCSLGEISPRTPSEQDNNQIGCEWLPLVKLGDYNLFPLSLIESIKNQTFLSRYVGNVE